MGGWWAKLLLEENWKIVGVVGVVGGPKKSWGRVVVGLQVLLGGRWQTFTLVSPCITKDHCD
jgi:hypothetical protein